MRRLKPIETLDNDLMAFSSLTPQDFEFEFNHDVIEIPQELIDNQYKLMELENEGAHKKNELPLDTYKPITGDRLITVYYDPDEDREDTIISVKAERMGDLGLPYLCIEEVFAEKESRAKMNLAIPLDSIYELKYTLAKLIAECEKKDLL
jgi:hypothetical protein